MTTRKQVRDQIVGKAQAAGLSPTTTGIARKQLVTKAIHRAMDAAETIQTLLAARDSADPTSQEIARRLLANTEFIAALSTALESIKADVKSAMDGNDQPTTPKGADYPETGAANTPADPMRGSGLPGSDAALRPGSYTKDQLIVDLATQNAAAVKLARSVGVDAANARVARTPLIPPWDSVAWSEEAREAFRQRAQFDGFAQSHIRGNVPTIDQYLSPAADAASTNAVAARTGGAKSIVSPEHMSAAQQRS